MSSKNKKKSKAETKQASVDIKDEEFKVEQELAEKSTGTKKNKKGNTVQEPVQEPVERKTKKQKKNVDIKTEPTEEYVTKELEDSSKGSKKGKKIKTKLEPQAETEEKKEETLESSPKKKTKKKKNVDDLVPNGSHFIKHEEIAIKDEHYSEEIEHEPEHAERAKSKMSAEDCLILLNKIKENIPESDIVYKTSITQLNWERIAFDNYSAEDCKNEWDILERKIRKMRTLGEVMDAAIIHYNNPKFRKRKMSETAHQPEEKKPKLFKPKPPQTPFNLYAKEQYAKQPPETDKTIFREKCKEEWKNMTDKKKLIWITRCEQEVKNYEEAVKKYQEVHPDFVAVKSRVLISKDEKALKDKLSGKPEQPPNSAYSLFSRLLLRGEEIKQVDAKNRLTFVSERWKSCSENERSKYKEQATQMMEQYKKDFEKYLESLPDDLRQKEMEKSAPKTKRKLKNDNPEQPLPKKPKMNSRKKTDSNKIPEPETPPISTYMYFLSKFSGPKQKAKQAWKVLSVDKKKKYEKELDEVKQKYMIDFEKFLNSLTKKELEEYSKNRAEFRQDDEEDSDTSEEEVEDSDADSDD